MKPVSQRFLNILLYMNDYLISIMKQFIEEWIELWPF